MAEGASEKIDSMQVEIDTLQQEVDSIDGFQLELQTKAVCVFYIYT
jgi:hypothetical protein